MTPNVLIMFLAAIIPSIVGAIWYHPKLMGNAWMKATGVDLDAPVKKYIFAYLLNVLLAFALYLTVTHEAHILGIVEADLEALRSGTGKAFIQQYGGKFAHFGHGALHGVFGGLIGFGIPLLGQTAMFEKKGFKYVLINLGYWIISMALMGGVIAQWGGKLVQ